MMRTRSVAGPHLRVAVKRREQRTGQPGQAFGTAKILDTVEKPSTTKMPVQIRGSLKAHLLLSLFYFKSFQLFLQ